MSGRDRSALDYGSVTSSRCVDEPASRVWAFTSKILERAEQVTRSPLGHLARLSTFAGIVPYDEIPSNALPSTGVNSRRIIKAGNYLVVPQHVDTEPEVVLYYTAYRRSAEETDWVIGPDSVVEFVRNAETYEWLVLLLEYAKTTDDRDLLDRLTAAHEAAKSGKTILERLHEMYQARRGAAPTRRGSAVSLLADLALNAAGVGLAIAGGRARKRRERAMVRLIEGAKRLGIEPFVVHVGEERNIGSDGNRYHTVRFRTVFFDVEDIEARVEARQNVIEYCERRLDKIDESPPTRTARERFEWIRDTLVDEVRLLEAGATELVGPGGEVNIYWLLNIHSTAKEMRRGE